MTYQDPYSAEASVTLQTVKDRVEHTSGAVVAPRGTSREILKWVGYDRAKAQLALEQERSADTPRKGLVRELEELLK